MLKWSYNSAPDIPDAIYAAKISGIEEKKSSKGNDMWVFTLTLAEINATVRYFQVVDGNFDYVASQAIASSIERVAKCFSIPEGNDNPQEWIGRSGIIETYHKTAPNGNTYINVKKFYSPSAGKKALTQQLAAKMVDAQFDFSEGFNV